MNMLLSKKSTVRSSGNDTRITLCSRSVRLPRETLRFSTPLPFPTATLPPALKPLPSNPQIAPALSCRFACCSPSASYWAQARPHLSGEAEEAVGESWVVVESLDGDATEAVVGVGVMGVMGESGASGGGVAHRGRLLESVVHAQMNGSATWIRTPLPAARLTARLAQKLRPVRCKLRRGRHTREREARATV